MNASQLPYLLAFNSLLKLKATHILAICDCYGGDAAEAWRHPESWAEPAELTPHLAEELLEMRRVIDPQLLMSSFLASGAGVACLGDNDYPSLLARIFDPPLLLFYYGHLPAEDEICLAMIGSRRASGYGHQVAEIVSRDLAAQGMVIISGMARGIDSICHNGALSVGGRTVAVLGSGLDVVYPRENRRLYEQICEQGAVVSEFPLGSTALPHNFPRRNRIISGLSRGVVVIEADEKSGTLLTVNYALEQGRDIFSVPGSIISPTSRGTNRLIRDGAIMLLSAEDVWRQYSSEPMKKAPPAVRGGRPAAVSLTAGEKRLLAMLVNPMRIDDLISSGDLDMETPALAALLTMLEIRGLLRQLPGKYYQTIVRHIRA